MTTPEELREIRETLELNQLEFAEKLGYTRQFISAMERGAKNITTKTEARLKKLGLLPTKSKPQNTFNLTEKEYEELVKFIEEDKYTLFLLIKARGGDAKAADMLKKIL